MKIEMKYLLCLLLSLVLVRAIYEEQAGEFDWQLENIGFVEKAFHGKKTYVSTEDGVIACLNTKTKEIDWRVVLSPDEKVVEMVLGPGKLFSLSNNSIVRCWDILSGSLIWDAFIPEPDDIKLLHKRFGHLPTGLSLDTSGEGSLLVLVNNQLTIYSLYGERERQASADEIILQVTDEQTPPAGTTRLVLSHLLSMPKGSGGAVGGSKDWRVAVGCLVSLSHPLLCLSSVLVQAIPHKSYFSANTHPALPVPPSHLMASVGGKLETDMLLALTSSTLEILHLSSKKHVSLSLSPLSLTGDVMRPPTLSLLSPTSSSSEIDESPVVLSHCTQSRDKTGLSSQSCELFSISSLTSSLTPLALCQGQLAIFGGESSPLLSHSYSSVGCASYTSITNRLDSRSGSAAVLQLQQVTREGKESLITESVSQSQKRVTLETGLYSYFPQCIRVKEGERKGQIIIRGVIQSVTGDLQIINNGKVIWRRLEGLSRVRELVLVDRILAEQRLQGEREKEKEKEGEEEKEEEMPDLMTRLAMQRDDLQEMVVTLPQSISSFLSSLLSSLSLSPSSPPSLEERLAHREKVGMQFGFDKIAVCINSKTDVSWNTASWTSLSLIRSQGGISGWLGLQVSGIDVLRGAPVWSFSPVLDGLWSIGKEIDSRFGEREREGEEVKVRVRARLLVTRAHRRGGHTPQVALMLSLQRSDTPSSLSLTAYWLLDASTGGASSHSLSSLSPSLSHPSSTSEEESGKSSPTANLKLKLKYEPSTSTPSLVMISPAVMSVSLHTQPDHSHTTFLLTHEGPLVSLFPPVSLSLSLSLLSGYYVHHLDKETGQLTCYQTDTTHPLSTQGAISRAGSLTSLSLSLLSVKLIASSVLHSDTESIHTIGYPNLDSDALIGPNRVTVLGDDSLLLKYINPHIIAVASIERETERNMTWQGASSTFSPSLSLTLFDTVSARIVYRISIRDGGCGPISLKLLDHRVFLSYWNCKVKRAEMLSVSLYEGMLGKYALSPFSSSFSSKSLPVSLSAFTLHPPIAMEKSFILPRAVALMDRTRTHRGITNKDVLLALGNGQVISLDVRGVDPRRPMTPPSLAEKEEGLHQYTPYLSIDPHDFITLNSSIKSIRCMVTSSSEIESTSLVIITGLDILFNKVTPSGGFDMLASDFNRPLLLATLIGLFIGTISLRKMTRKKVVTQGWM